MQVTCTSHAKFTNARVIEALVTHALLRTPEPALQQVTTFTGAHGSYTVKFLKIREGRLFAAVWLQNCTVAGHAEVTP